MEPVLAHHYMIVLSGGPLIVIRVPMTPTTPPRKKQRKAKERWAHVPRWRDILKALTPVMQSHGMRNRDILSLDNLAHPNAWDPPEPGLDDYAPPPGSPGALREATAVENELKARDNAIAAYEGARKLANFWLYDWTPRGFVLVRQPLA